jgi:hypothetical protein
MVADNPRHPTPPPPPGVSAPRQITLHLITAHSPRLDVAISLLSKTAEHSREFVDLFLDTLGDRSQLVRLDVDDSAALSAGEIRIVLEPSERLLGFLAAAGARDV